MGLGKPDNLYSTPQGTSSTTAAGNKQPANTSANLLAVAPVAGMRWYVSSLTISNQVTGQLIKVADSGGLWEEAAYFPVGSFTQLVFPDPKRGTLAGTVTCTLGSAGTLGDVYVAMTGYWGP